MNNEIIAHVLHGHDNDRFAIPHATNIVRCKSCGEILSKGLELKGFDVQINLDVSSTYDGYTIVSERFRCAYNDNGFQGLRFNMLENISGYYSVTSELTIKFDFKRRKTRFENIRPCCSRYQSVVGATPAFLLENHHINDVDVFITDIEFGSGDEKHPLLIFPSRIKDVIKQRKLTGCELSDVCK